MRNFFTRLLVLASMLAMAACGGGGDDAFSTPDANPPGGSATVSVVTVTSSAPTILADGSTSADITAMVRDANNNLMANVAVTFNASSGGVAIVAGTTDSAGVAKATLTTAGDSTLRNITVSATASGVSGNTTVAVIAPPPAPTAASMTLITSSPTITSSGATTATITAIVRNTNNQFLANVPVQFSATSGGMNVTQATTDANGAATAVLSAAGDPTNRSITVSATSGTVTQTVGVDVTGTTLVLQGPTSLALGQKATYTVVLANSNAQGIAGKQVTVASSAANTLSAATLTTNVSGQATFDLTVANATPSPDTITVTALGLSTPLAVAINSDAFKFVAPLPNTELPINTPTTTNNTAITVNWLQGSTPQVGKTVTFTTTRGAFVEANGQAVTDANGDAVVHINSSNAGFGTITATGAGGSTAQLPVEFIAQTPSTIEVQSSAFTIGPSETATLTAVVRDARGNLVKNKTVVFTLTDVSGGVLSAGTAVTDSNGRAQTIYTAGANTSAQDGVVILATAQGFAGVQDDVKLTVARREVFISMGTGNSITEPNAATYKVEYLVQVTDASGAGVPNVPISMSVLSTRYYKGFRFLSGTTGWVTCYTTVAVGQTPSSMNAPISCNTSPAGGCFDEDTNRNGVLDAETYTDTNGNKVYDVGEPFNDANGDGLRNRGEDQNDSNRIEAGNIALAAPANVVTDANGQVIVSVSYPQEYAYYVEVTLQARTSVQGTEFVRQSTFLLAGSADDFKGSTSPPGPFSAFGTGTSCTDTK